MDYVVAPVSYNDVVMAEEVIYADVLDLLNKNPSWFFINHHIEQKKIGV
jgi:hypothetical protein